MNLYRLKSKKPIKKADKKPIKKADKGSIKKTGKKPIKTERQKLILNHVKEYGMISNKEARAILGLAESTTKRILKQMSEDGILQEQGERRARIYILK